MRRRLAIVITAAFACVGAGISGCSNGQPAGYTHYDPGAHSVTISGRQYDIDLPGKADLKVTGTSVIPSDLGVDAAIRGSDESRNGLYSAPGGSEQFYFLLTDRFANGNSLNNTGGLGEDSHISGYDPTKEGFYLGGDLQGVIDHLDYIKGLGTTALWITPPMKNKAVQGEGDAQSSGYHGYWVTDFTKIDPHIGNKDKFQELVDKAHDRGLKVYMDIITNHTADVISYGDKSYDYVPTTIKPYTTSDGSTVNLFQVADSENFPKIDPKSFPHQPVAGEPTKVPSWLNKTELYHNRGDSTFSGESVTLGDIYGLDDLMTENPEVVRGMEDIYRDWLSTGIDGFRIDTVKHVNMEFWKDWTQAIKAKADKSFFMFGEVADTNIPTLATYVRDTDMDAVLDFGFQKAVVAYVNGGKAQGLSDLFAQDSRYVTEHSTSTDLPTFLGNHDMGRVGMFLHGDKKRDSVFAHALMFTMRGQPIVYYGDEQGFVGDGGDKVARQPLFATKVESYQKQKLLDGTEFGTGEHMSTDAPMYQVISKLSKYRSEHPGLATGSQIELLNDGNVYAFSRVDAKENVEYVVVANSGDAEVQTTVPALTTTEKWDLIMEASDGTISAPANAKHPEVNSSAGTTNLKVRVPPHGVKVYQAGEKVGRGTGITSLTGKRVDDTYIELSADTQDYRYAQTSFFYRVVGSGKWFPLGSVAGPDPKIYQDLSKLKPGTLVEYRAITDGKRGYSYTYLVGGPPTQLPAGPPGQR